MVNSTSGSTPANPASKAAVQSTRVKTKEEIAALFAELENICKASRIPCSLVYAKDVSPEGETEYAQHVVTPVQCNLKLKNDLITPSLMYIRKGFKVVPAARADDNVFDPSEFVDDSDDDDE